MFDSQKSINRRRCVKVGATLVEGPKALFPPRSDDDSGWYEVDLRITKVTPGYRTLESVALYSDDTMNKEEGFLEPVLRYAAWSRRNDMSGDNAWPSIDIHLSKIADFEELNSQFLTLQSRVAEIGYKPLGISLARDMADVGPWEDADNYEIFFRNGVQGLTFESPELPGSPFVAKCKEVFDYIQQSIDPFAKEGWRESYDFNLEEYSGSKLWDLEHRAG